MDSTQRVDIRAEFVPIFRWTIVFIFSIAVFLFAAAWIGNRNSSGPQMTSAEMILLALQFVGWGSVGTVGFAGLLYGITRFTGVQVTPTEMAGRSYWGFRTRFSSSSVTGVIQTRYQGVRYLWISSSESSRQLSLVLLGVRIDKYVDDLSRVLGPEHELTKWFASNA